MVNRETVNIFNFCQDNGSSDFPNTGDSSQQRINRYLLGRCNNLSPYVSQLSFVCHEYANVLTENTYVGLLGDFVGQTCPGGGQ